MAGETLSIDQALDYDVHTLNTTVNGCKVRFVYGNNPNYCGIEIPPEYGYSNDEIENLLMAARNPYKAFVSLSNVLMWTYQQQDDEDLIQHTNHCRRVFQEDGLLFTDDVIERAKAQFQMIAWELERRRVSRNLDALEGRIKNRPGFVYLIQSPTGYYKIGRTKDPQNRMRTFGIQLPFEVEYACVIQTGNMIVLEQSLHSMFAAKHVNGEWFALDEPDVEFIKGLGA